MEREESFGDLTLKLNLLKIRGSQNTLLVYPSVALCEGGCEGGFEEFNQIVI